ncbi:MAG: undecaprenyl-phosphate galactose phosphotransferase WbaP [Hydrogenobaculum sp.]|nr:MAG: undecaprenyl-phosphate galactose phosphotransferase WbaP [Hydrogenobaculum sp.]
MKRFLRIFLLISIDVAAFYTALFLAYITRKILGKLFIKNVIFSFSFEYFLSFWWMPMVFIFFLWYQKLYTRRYTFWYEVEEIIKAVFLSGVFIFAVLSLSKISLEMSRLTLILLCFYAIFTVSVLRYIGKKVLNRLDIWKSPIVIIGAGSSGKSVAKGIIDDWYLGYEIKGFLDDFKSGFVEVKSIKIPIIGKVEKIKDLKEENIEAAIVSIPSLGNEELAHLVNTAHRYIKQVFVVPDLKGIGLLNSELYHIFTEQLFLIKITNNLDSKLNQITKQTFDILLSLITLPVLVFVISIFAILIKIDSEGPVFFVQERLGKNGKIFKCIKFRTMYVNSQEILENFLKENKDAQLEWQTFKKLKKYDPRVTRVGRFLRKTSLDELPQIFNVLKGDMSLVGPRPYLPSEEKDMGDYKDYILLTKPGITGLWQVSGRNELSFEERLKLDTWYVLNWSLWFDIVIILKTIRVVFKKEGAY